MGVGRAHEHAGGDTVREEIVAVAPAATDQRIILDAAGPWCAMRASVLMQSIRHSLTSETFVLYVREVAAVQYQGMAAPYSRLIAMTSPPAALIRSTASRSGSAATAIWNALA